MRSSRSQVRFSGTAGPSGIPLDFFGRRGRRRQKRLIYLVDLASGVTSTAKRGDRKNGWES